MLKRNLFHLVLMLLLMFTQQVAQTHGYTHWNAHGDATLLADAQGDDNNDDDGDLKQQHGYEACNQCLLIAQLVAAPPFASSAIAQVRPTSFHDLPVPAAVPCQRTVCAFHSRAPPLV